MINRYDLNKCSLLIINKNKNKLMSYWCHARDVMYVLRHDVKESLDLFEPFHWNELFERTVQENFAPLPFSQMCFQASRTWVLSHWPPLRKPRPRCLDTCFAGKLFPLSACVFKPNHGRGVSTSAMLSWITLLWAFQRWRRANGDLERTGELNS